MSKNRLEGESSMAIKVPYEVTKVETIIDNTTYVYYVKAPLEATLATVDASVTGQGVARFTLIDDSISYATFEGFTFLNVEDITQEYWNNAPIDFKTVDGLDEFFDYYYLDEDEDYGGDYFED